MGLTLTDLQVLQKGIDERMGIWVQESRGERLKTALEFGREVSHSIDDFHRLQAGEFKHDLTFSTTVSVENSLHCFFHEFVWKFPIPLVFSFFTTYF